MARITKKWLPLENPLVQAHTVETRQHVDDVAKAAEVLREAWAQVGHDIVRMRTMVERHSVTRQMWMTEVGLGDILPQHISPIVRWAIDGDELTDAGAVGRFVGNPKSIIERYARIVPKDEVIEEWQTVRVPTSPFSVNDVAFLHGDVIGSEIGRDVAEAKAKGAEPVAALQFAEALARARLRVIQEQLNEAAAKAHRDATVHTVLKPHVAQFEDGSDF